MTISEIAALLKGNGLRATPQRIAVYEYLRAHRTHPTADQIYHDLVARYPSFSKTTIYNSIRVLDEAGLIQPVVIDGDFSRYDACTLPHGHFKCLCCGSICDVFDCDWPDMPDSLANFKTQRVMLHYYGICPTCRAKQAQIASAKRLVGND